MMSEERLGFQAEVSRLLEIVAHSLYSDKEAFLRELVSNAADACDKLRYAALTDANLLGEDAAFKIKLEADRAARTLSIIDNGIGMNRQELIDHLGTIARSGTSAFVQNLSGDAAKDGGLIGQFGVGFYSAFMVATKVDVFTRKAGETGCWRWSSDGKGDFVVAEAQPEECPARGARIVLSLRDGEDDFLDEARLRATVKKYSDHISIPVYLGQETEPANAANALWMQPKASIDAERYKEFYRHVSHSFDEPWLTMHWRAEGVIDYAALLFIPRQRPFDAFDPRRAHHVKLYVRRVFIAEGAEGLLPPYLRFLTGVADCQDLPLNVSREMLQNNPILAKLKSGIVKRTLSELARKADDPEQATDYAHFWNSFGPLLKEGLYEDYAHRDELLKLLRFETTTSDGALVSLDDYVARMKPGQEAIYYITGDDKAALVKSPQLEGFRAKGVEALLLCDPVDDFWLGAVREAKGKPFKSVTRGGADLAAIAGDAPNPTQPACEEGEWAALTALLKLSLGDAIKDVRRSERLTDSPVCLVADEGDMDIHLEKLLKQHGQLQGGARKRVLEINPAHPMVRRLAAKAQSQGSDPALEDAAWLLLDQARILEGEAVPDPVTFAKRLAGFMERSL
jgi:molecular chaperone HtpG